MAVLEARKLKKMDITGASDPYVKIKLFDNKVSFKIKEHAAFLCPFRKIYPTNKIFAYFIAVTIPALIF